MNIVDLKKKDLVLVNGDQNIYVIEEIQDNIATVKGFTHRIRKDVDISLLKKAGNDQILQETKAQETLKHRVLQKKERRSKHQILYGRILHIDGDKEFLESCLSLYQEMNIPSDGLYLHEEDIKDKIEHLLLTVTPDIVVITGHDVYNGKGIKDLKNYQNSKHFMDAVRMIRKHFDRESVVVIVGACASHFEALLASGANFSSSPKRINIHTYDPAIIAIKVATTSCNKNVDFNQILELIENKRDAFGGIETKGKMKIML